MPPTQEHARHAVGARKGCYTCRKEGVNAGGGGEHVPSLHRHALDVRTPHLAWCSGVKVRQGTHCSVLIPVYVRLVCFVLSPGTGGGGVGVLVRVNSCDCRGLEKGANGHDWLDKRGSACRGIKVLTKARSPQQSLNAETTNIPGIEAS